MFFKILTSIIIKYDNLRIINFIYPREIYRCEMYRETYGVLKKLESYPTFGVDTIANITGAKAGYARLYINRLEKKGMIQKIQRNVYTVQKDPLVIASRITWPSYISLWSAIRYHGLTEQLPNEISVLTTSAKSRKAVSVIGTSIIFTRIKPEYFFGFSKIIIDGFEVFMAEPEKAILDMVMFKKSSLSEVYSIMEENAGVLSLEKLADHVVRAGNAAAAKRLGWVLDRLGSAAAKKLLPMTYGTSIPLDYARPLSGVTDHKWGVNKNMAASE